MKTIALHNGVQMPVLIMSTAKMDYPTMKKVVSAGLRCGYRAFDTARDYGNENIVGRVLHECLEEQGLERKDIFITTKIGNGQQRQGNIAEQIDISLHHLQTDYVDCWLMHWPYPDYFIDTYHKMEDVYRSGKARAIGMANYNLRYFNKLWEAGFDIAPHVHQFEHHPLRTADEIVSFCKKHHIAIQSYSPLCRMIPRIRESEVLRTIAARVGKTVGQVILRWHYQQGTVPCFQSVKPERMAENISLWDFELTEEDMQSIHDMDENYKYHLESASCPGY